MWAALARLLQRPWWAQAEFFLDSARLDSVSIAYGRDCVGIGVFAELFTLLEGLKRRSKDNALVDCGYFSFDSTYPGTGWLRDIASSQSSAYRKFRSQYEPKDPPGTANFASNMLEVKIYAESGESRYYRHIESPQQNKLARALEEVMQHSPRHFLGIIGVTTPPGFDESVPDMRAVVDPLFRSKTPLRPELEAWLSLPEEWWLRRREFIMRCLRRDGYEVDSSHLYTRVRPSTMSLGDNGEMKPLIPPLISLRSRERVQDNRKACSSAHDSKAPKWGNNHATGAAASSPSALIYEPLDSVSHEIRVLQVLPTTDYDDAIECLITKTVLGGGVRFSALSYVWGDAKVTEDIRVNAQTFRATTNLVEALRHIRAARKPTILDAIWIDAICINQNDVPEKNQQVKLMGSIYQSAESVVSWLGAESPDSAATLLFIQQAAECLRAAGFQPLDFFARIESLMGGRREGLLSKTVINGLTELLKRQAFYRGWVFQESYLAQERFFVCGHDWVNAEDFEALTATMRNWAMEPSTTQDPAAATEDTRDSKKDHLLELGIPLADAEAMESSPLERTVLESTEAASRLAFSLPGCGPAYVDKGNALLGVFGRFFRTSLVTKKRLLQGLLSSGRPAASRLSYLLLFTLRLLVTNPRDKVYCLLAVAGVDMDVDYEGWIADLYCSVADHFLVFRRSFSDVGLHATPEVERTVPDLPSWAPDFHALSKRKRIDPFFRTIHASRGLDLNPSLSIHGRNLRVSGLRAPVGPVISVSVLGGLRYTAAAFGAYLLSSGECYPTGLPKVQALLSAILDHRGTHSPVFTSDSQDSLDFDNVRHSFSLFYPMLIEFARTIWGHWPGRPEPNPYDYSTSFMSRRGFQQQFEAEFRPQCFGTDPCPLGTSADDPLFTEISDPLSFAGKGSEERISRRLHNFTMKNDNFFHTEGGYFGFSQCPVETGDAFYVFPGFDDLVVLREQEGRYIMLGTCWVKGFMEGEIR
ncbi:hypothetical protein ACJ41O_006217 [Fusarium nematophilum]